MSRSPPSDEEHRRQTSATSGENVVPTTSLPMKKRRRDAFSQCAENTDTSATSVPTDADAEPEAEAAEPRAQRMHVAHDNSASPSLFTGEPVAPAVDPHTVELELETRRCERLREENESMRLNLAILEQTAEIARAPPPESERSRLEVERLKAYETAARADADAMERDARLVQVTGWPWMCLVCTARPAGYAIVPCGHFVLCRSCAAADCIAHSVPLPCRRAGLGSTVASPPPGTETDAATATRSSEEAPVAYFESRRRGTSGGGRPASRRRRRGGAPSVGTMSAVDFRNELTLIFQRHLLPTTEDNDDADENLAQETALVMAWGDIPNDEGQSSVDGVSATNATSAMTTVPDRGTDEAAWLRYICTRTPIGVRATWTPDVIGATARVLHDSYGVTLFVDTHLTVVIHRSTIRGICVAETDPPQRRWICTTRPDGRDLVVRLDPTMAAATPPLSLHTAAEPEEDGQTFSGRRNASQEHPSGVSPAEEQNNTHVGRDPSPHNHNPLVWDTPTMQRVGHLLWTRFRVRLFVDTFEQPEIRHDAERRVTTVRIFRRFRREEPQLGTDAAFAWEYRVESDGTEQLRRVVAPEVVVDGGGGVPDLDNVPWGDGPLGRDSRRLSAGSDTGRAADGEPAGSVSRRAHQIRNLFGSGPEFGRGRLAPDSSALAMPADTWPTFLSSRQCRGVCPLCHCTVAGLLRIFIPEGSCAEPPPSTGGDEKTTGM